MRFADDIDAPAVMFPTVQTCAEGEHRWVEVPSDPAEAVTFFGEAESPAAYVLLEGEEAEIEAASSAAPEGADEKRLAAEPVASEGDGNSDALSMVALGVGVLALMVGAAALVRAGAARRDVSQP